MVDLYLYPHQYLLNSKGHIADFSSSGSGIVTQFRIFTSGGGNFTSGTNGVSAGTTKISPGYTVTVKGEWRII